MYVYFIMSEGKPKRIKIGRSKDPERRVKQLQTGSPHPLHLMYKLRCKSEKHASEVELAAHSVFNKERQLGEWFKRTDHLMVRIFDMVSSFPNYGS